MPRKLKPDPDIAKRIRAAVKAIERGEPTDKGLRTRASRGTLKLSPTTVAIEARIERHLVGKPGCLYAEEHSLIVGRMGERGKSPPLRALLDEARKSLRESEADLERCRAMCVHALTLVHKQDLEVKRLQEELANRDEGKETDLIGTGRLSVLPVRQAKLPQSGSGAGARRG